MPRALPKSLFSAERATWSSWVTWGKEGNLIQLDHETIKGLQWQSVWRRKKIWFSVTRFSFCILSLNIFFMRWEKEEASWFNVELSAAHKKDTHMQKCLQATPELWILLIQTLLRWCPPSTLVCWAKESPCRGQAVSMCAAMERGSSSGRAEPAPWSSLGSVLLSLEIILDAQLLLEERCRGEAFFP